VQRSFVPKAVEPPQAEVVHLAFRTNPSDTRQAAQHPFFAIAGSHGWKRLKPVMSRTAPGKTTETG
jgi:hypothetical protein